MKLIGVSSGEYWELIAEIDRMDEDDPFVANIWVSYYDWLHEKLRKENDVAYNAALSSSQARYLAKELEKLADLVDAYNARIKRHES